MSLPDEGERRYSERTTLNLAISSRQRGRNAVPATLVTLSPHGCLLDDGLFNSVEQGVFVKLPGLENQPGAIVWTDGRKAGVRFQRPLHPAVFDRLAGHTSGQDAVAIRPDQSRVIQLPGTRRQQILGGHADPQAAVLARKNGKGVRNLSDLIGRSVRRQVEHRREERHTPTDPLDLQFQGKPARVANMSPKGLKLMVDLNEGVGERRAVEFPGFDPIEGRIIWIKNGATGIELPPESIDLKTD